MIYIEDIDDQNVFDVCELTTNKNGIGTTMEQYLCCNATSIAESKYFPQMHPKAIYHDNDLIGFMMYQHESTSKTATICRYMLDYKYHGQGLGKASFNQIIQYLKVLHFKEIVIMIDDDNTIAKHLYTSFGFKFTGKVLKDEHYYRLEL